MGPTTTALGHVLNQKYLKHIREHTNFEGKINSIDKVYMGCYHLSLFISQSPKEKILAATKNLNVWINLLNIPGLKPMKNN